MDYLTELKKLRVRLRSSDNPALRGLEANPKIKAFKKRLVKALQQQVALIATPENFERMGYFEKFADFDPFDLITAENSLADFIDVYEFLIESATAGGDVALKRMKIGASFKIKDVRLINQLKRERDWLITSLDKTTKKWVKDKVVNEFKKPQDEQGTLREIAESINQEFRQISISRAELIVSNEVANAAAISEMLTYKENGGQTWHWQTNNDGRVTIGCLENQAAGSRKIGEAFPSGHTHNPRFPGCRCWMEIDSFIRSNIGIWTG